MWTCERFQDLPLELHQQLSNYLSPVDLKHVGQSLLPLKKFDYYRLLSWKKCIVIPNDPGSEYELYNQYDRIIPLSVFLSPDSYSWFYNDQVRILDIQVPEWKSLGQLQNNIHDWMTINYPNLQALSCSYNETQNDQLQLVDFRNLRYLIPKASRKSSLIYTSSTTRKKTITKSNIKTKNFNRYCQQHYYASECDKMKKLKKKRQQQYQTKNKLPILSLSIVQSIPTSLLKISNPKALKSLSITCWSSLLNQQSLPSSVSNAASLAPPSGSAIGSAEAGALFSNEEISRLKVSWPQLLKKFVNLETFNFYPLEKFTCSDDQFTHIIGQLSTLSKLRRVGIRYPLSSYTGDRLTPLLDLPESLDQCVVIITCYQFNLDRISDPVVLPQVTHLIVEGHNEISQLDKIAKFPKLKYLAFDRCEVSKDFWIGPKQNGSGSNEINSNDMIPQEEENMNQDSESATSHPSNIYQNGNDDGKGNPGDKSCTVDDDNSALNNNTIKPIFQSTIDCTLLTRLILRITDKQSLSAFVLSLHLSPNLKLLSLDPPAGLFSFRADNEAHSKQSLLRAASLASTASSLSLSSLIFSSSSLLPTIRDQVSENGGILSPEDKLKTLQLLIQLLSRVWKFRIGIEKMKQVLNVEKLQRIFPKESARTIKYIYRTMFDPQLNLISNVNNRKEPSSHSGLTNQTQSQQQQENQQVASATPRNIYEPRVLDTNQSHTPQQIARNSSLNNTRTINFSLPGLVSSRDRIPVNRELSSSNRAFLIDHQYNNTEAQQQETLTQVTGNGIYQNNNEEEEENNTFETNSREELLEELLYPFTLFQHLFHVCLQHLPQLEYLSVFQMEIIVTCPNFYEFLETHCSLKQIRFTQLCPEVVSSIRTNCKTSTSAPSNKSSFSFTCSTPSIKKRPALRSSNNRNIATMKFRRPFNSPPNQQQQSRETNCLSSSINNEVYQKSTAEFLRNYCDHFSYNQRRVSKALVLDVESISKGFHKFREVMNPSDIHYKRAYNSTFQKHTECEYDYDLWNLHDDSQGWIY